MYESLRGTRTTIEEIINNNFICCYESEIANSHHALSLQEPNFGKRMLARMLMARNGKYGDEGIGVGMERVGDFVAKFLGKTDHSMRDLQAASDGMRMSREIYGCEEGDQILDEIQANFCQFSLDSEQDFKNSIRKQQKTDQFIQKVARNLRKLNNEAINNREQDKNNNQQQFGLQLLEIMETTDPYFMQLNRQMLIVAKNEEPIAILSQIMDFDNTNLLNYLISLAFREPAPSPSEKIYFLFIAELPSKRVLLDRYLYELNQQKLFSLISEYDKLLDPTIPHTSDEIDQYSEKVVRWKQQTKMTNYDVYLCSLLCYGMELMVPTWQLAKRVKPSEDIAFQIGAWFLRIKFLRWLEVKIQDQGDRKVRDQQIIERFKQCRPELLKDISVAPCLLNLKLLNFKASTLYLSEHQKFLLALVITLQPSIFKQLLGVTSQQFQISYYQQQLALYLQQFNKDSKPSGLLADCLHLLSKEDQIKLLASSKKMVQCIDWQYVLSLMKKQQQKNIVKIVIIRSIRMYQNTAYFLNSNIPLQSILPYFQIQILIEGLRAILTQNAKLTEKDKSKFFGMISIYRGQNLPLEHQFQMTILQMLFQWFVLRESVIEQDYKSIGLSLRSNLEEHEAVEEQISHFSLRMTGSSKAQSILRIHNHQYTRRIGRTDFIERLVQAYEYQHLYVGYMHTLAESICKIKQSKQKIIRKTKLQLWIEVYLNRISSNLRQSKGELHNKLLNLRVKSLSLFAIHNF